MADISNSRFAELVNINLENEGSACASPSEKKGHIMNELYKYKIGMGTLWDI